MKPLNDAFLTLRLPSVLAEEFTLAAHKEERDVSNALRVAMLAYIDKVYEEHENHSRPRKRTVKRSTHRKARTPR